MESNVTNTSPAYDLAKLETLEGCFNELFRNKFMGLECCIPAIVISYDRPSHIATVQPAVNLVLANGKTTERPKISMSVMRMSSGGFLLDMPIAAGDTGWIVASDRDSTVVKQNSKKAPPLSLDMHKYEHGFFVPDKWGTIAIDSEDDGCMVLSSPNGETKIRISNGNIDLISSGTIGIKSNLNIIGNATISGNAIISCNSTISGEMSAKSIFMNIDGSMKQLVKKSITYNNGSEVVRQDFIVPSDSEPSTLTITVTTTPAGTYPGTDYFGFGPVEQYALPGDTISLTVIQGSYQQGKGYYISSYWINVDDVRVLTVNNTKLYAGTVITYTIPTTAESNVFVGQSYSYPKS